MPIENKAYKISVDKLEAPRRLEISLFKNNSQIGYVQTTTDKFIVDNTNGDYDKVRIGLSNGTYVGTVTFANLMMIEGTEEKPYEPYGTMPSPDYPSEVRGCGDSGNITIKKSNKNLFNITSPVKQVTAAGVDITIAEDGLITLNGAARGAAWPDLIWGINTNTDVHKKCKYYFPKTINNVVCTLKEVSGSYTGLLEINILLNDDSSNHINIKPNKNSVIKGNELKGINRAYFSFSNQTFNNYKFYIQLEEGTVATNYIPHKCETYTIPLEEGQTLDGLKTSDLTRANYIDETGQGWTCDYTADDGIHKRIGKVTLDGTENIHKAGSSNTDYNSFYFKAPSILDTSDLSKIMSNMFVSSSVAIWANPNGYLCRLDGDGYNIYFSLLKTEAETVTEVKKWVADKYNSGNPVVFKYELAEEGIIPYTEAQQKVLNQIKLDGTDKNITYFYSEDEIKPIQDITYFKDIETEHNKLQTQIDEIKALLSTTATSALLLDNMQTDLESEVL